MSEKKIKPTARQLVPGEAYEVSALGSLGLLALGDLGLIAWREAREKAVAEQAGDEAQDKNKESQA
jgi:hypothetical protein